MGGDATFSGTTYQARVIAFIYVHILATARLGWLGLIDDTPQAVAGETDGPGDDARVELAGPGAIMEVQAKHGLGAGAELLDVLKRIKRKMPSAGAFPVVLAVDRNSTTRWIYTQLPSDIERLRSGRPDDIRRDTATLLRDLASQQIDDDVLRTLRIAPVDIDNAQDPEAKSALQMLERFVLDDPAQAGAAWSVLVDDAATICAQKQRRTRRDLVALLQNGKNIRVRPPAKDDALHRDLDFVKLLMERRHFEAALAHLRAVEGRTELASAEPLVRYRLYVQKGSSLLQMDEPIKGLESARKALEFDDQGIMAYTVAVHSAIAAGRLSDATSFAQRAFDAHPLDPRAWGLRALASAASGNNPPEAPPGVAEATDYRRALLEIAVNSGDKLSILGLTADLIKEGVREPVILFHRANTLIDAGGLGLTLSDAERFSEVERLATDVITQVEGTQHPLEVSAYVLRAGARQLQGRQAEADADLAAARSLDADDVDAISLEARRCIEAGDLGKARELLLTPSVNDVPELIALRARVAAMMEEPLHAKRDLEAAIAAIRKSHDSDRVRFVIADVAILLGDLSLAEQILAGIPTGSRGHLLYHTIRARISFAKGDIEEGERLYRAAIAARADAKPDLVAELGSHLRAAKLYASAIEVFEEIPLRELPAEALQLYAAALFREGKLAAVGGVLEHLGTVGSLPDWALAAAVELAQRQEDPTTAIRHLEELVNRGAARAEALLTLARLYIEIERPVDAKPHLDVLLRTGDLTPVQRMQLAQLLSLSGRTEEALPIAHSAYLDRPGDAQLNRAFIMMVLMGKGEPPEASEVAPDTYVKLGDGKAATREYVVLDREDIDPRRHEISVSDAKRIGLLGKKPGEAVSLRAGGQGDGWRIVELVPTLVRDAQRAAMAYEESFPSEPFFIRSFEVGDMSRVEDLAGIISTLEGRKRRAEKALAMYRKDGFPLGAIAKLLGASITDVMQSIERNPIAGSLIAEWAPRGSYANSVLEARSAKKVVLTESSLATLAGLGILDTVADRFELVAPRALVDDMREQLKEAREMVANGHTVLLREGDAMRGVELSAGHPSLVAHEAELARVLRFLESRVATEARPIETIVANDSAPGSLREMIGRGSYDSILLAQHLDVPMIADDLGIRRMEVRGRKARSFSTVAFLEGLRDDSVLPAVERIRHLATLAAKRYAFITPTPELLSDAIRRSSETGQDHLRRVMATLGNPGIELGDAARVAAMTVRTERFAPVQVMTSPVIVSMALDAMAQTWPPEACVRAMVRVASVEFAMAPTISDDVLQACRGWLSRHIQRSIVT